MKGVILLKEKRAQKSDKKIIMGARIKQNKLDITILMKKRL